MIDLHVHTARCGHAEGTPDEYVAAAAAAGIETIAFCDHLPLPPHHPPGYAMTWPELPLYVSEISDLAARSAAEGGPEVLVGIEADWIPGFERLVAGALETHAFDLVLGSVHFIDGWAFDDPAKIARYSEWPSRGALGALLQRPGRRFGQRDVRRHGAPRPREEVRTIARDEPESLVRGGRRGLRALRRRRRGEHGRAAKARARRSIRPPPFYAPAGSGEFPRPSVRTPTARKRSARVWMRAGSNCSKRGTTRCWCSAAGSPRRWRCDAGPRP